MMAKKAARQVVRSAAIYARISADVEGKSLGVQRQLEDCRKLAADRGWPVGAEYVDNDVSAFSGKPRRQYARMLAELESGDRDAVIVYNLDRLHRRPAELEKFVAVCERVGVSQVATVTADIDLGNDDGLFMARIFAAFAAKESGRKSARIRRKLLQNAEAGLPHGSVRPFGYEDDKITLRESERAVVREMVDRYLAGQSIKSVTVWLSDSGVAPAVATSWQTSAVRQILCSGRIAGLREHRGQVLATAQTRPRTWCGGVGGRGDGAAVLGDAGGDRVTGRDPLPRADHTFGIQPGQLVQARLIGLHGGS
jgi:site-specific DNA recombinase